MSDLLSIDKLQLFLLFIIPGFISLKVWTLIVPSRKIETSKSVIDVISYSLINFAILFWIPIIAINQDKLIIQIFLYILLLLIGPILWPIILKLILNSKLFRGKIIHPTPKAWDYFFSLREPCFMLIHLKNGNLIGGQYYKNSFASSYPEKEDLYLNEVWNVNKKGEFIKKIKETKGLLINYDFIDYIELFEIKKGE